MFNENGYITLFSLTHIIYIIVILTLFVLGIIFLRKKENKKLIIRIIGIILLVLIILNRIDCTKHDIDPSNPNYFLLIPHSYCGVTTFILAIMAIFYKKSNIVIESLFVYSLFGGLSNVFYPTYIESQYIWEPRTWTGLLHHALSAFLMIYLIATGEIKPSIKKWYYFPLAALAMLSLGYFDVYVLNLESAMYIYKPVVSSLPTLTNGWMLNLWLFIVNMLFLTIYEIVKRHKRK